MNFSAVLDALNNASAFELFRLREGNERGGVVPRLNDKTVTMQVGQQQWRAGYQFLHHVVDSIAGTAVDLPGQTTFLPAEIT